MEHITRLSTRRHEVNLHVNFFKEGSEVGLVVKATNQVEAHLRSRRMVNAMSGVITHYGKIAGREYKQYSELNKTQKEG